MKNYKNIILLLIMCLTLSAGCTKNKQPDKHDGGKAGENTVTVRVQEVEKQLVQPKINVTGTLKASEQAVTSAENAGTLIRVNYKEGQSVSRGTILASVNPVDYILYVNNAEAALNQTKASYENVKAEYERKKTLFENEIIPKQQFDDIETKLTVGSSDIKRAEANLALAKQELKKSNIISPINGEVKTKFISRGDYVKEGTPLYEIIKIDPLKLFFTVSEENINKIKLNQEVSFIVNAFPDKEFKGKVSSIHPNLNEETRNLTIEAMVNNPDKKLKPGMFADVTIFTGNEKEVLTIPATSIMYNDEKAVVYTIKDGEAKHQEILVGNKYGEKAEVIKGLDEKQEVVTMGQQQLKEGAKVNVAR